MSALGHKRTYAPQQAMSALRLIATAKADMCQWSCPLYPRKQTCAVRQGMSVIAQKRTWPALFKNLGGAGEDRMRYRDADPLSGLEIDHQFVLGRRLYWQIGRLLALEDAIDIASGASVVIESVRPVRDQAA